ncbi:hypothetical protein BZG36_04115 [Bifiguratus adelaidae]|uniref:NmrA-like domain-containing protein n=1 Tax=Bifiguratus adelaidae TaxID=1938954 RepID=A0A261XX37_9FUNG|nr:hypothetical protein BZG36_04115 [Bifiguratus adelaidae]
MTDQRILVTCATGELGRLAVKHLLQRGKGIMVIAGVRDPNSETAKSLEQAGAELRVADYDKPETLDAAFAGVDTLLLISSSAPTGRYQHHVNAINAAKRAGVKLLVYTSLLKADISPMRLMIDPREIEKAIMDSGIPFVILRNGWYHENYLGSLKATLEYGAQLGSSKDGRISAASRDELAEAAAIVVISGENHAGRAYELAGDEAYTLSEFAAELSRQSGKQILYKDLPEEDYKKTLMGFGLPEPIAASLADADVQAASGALYDDSHQLSKLIGHSTAPLSKVIANALAAQ